MKKIIYATDYSAGSVAALKYAVSLGQLIQEDIIVLHVYNPEEEKKHEEKKAVRQKYQKKSADFCKKHLGENYQASELSYAAIKGGNVPEAILEFVRDLNIHMIIMGACSTSAIKEMIVGSTTKVMTEISPFPVLAVPPKFEPGKIESVLYSSLLHKEDVGHLEDLIEILHPAKPEIHIVHITHKDEQAANAAIAEFKNLVVQKMEYPDLKFHSIYSNHVYETLESTIEDMDPDLVVMPDLKEKNEMDKVIIRDKIKKMQSCTKIPILTFTSN